MAAGPVRDAGEEVPCPSCGTPVLQKKMIPVLGDGGKPSYLCVDCARALRPSEASEAGAG